MTNPPKFGSATEALLALSCDKLALVQYSADHVFVTTIFGCGKFTRDEWRMVNGPEPSVYVDSTKSYGGNGADCA